MTERSGPIRDRPGNGLELKAADAERFAVVNVDGNDANRYGSRRLIR